METDMKASEILEESARVLSEHGHCKGSLEDSQGRMCLQGAMKEAYFGQSVQSEKAWVGAQLTMKHYIQEMTGRPFIAPYEWNDLVETTAEDVLLAFKQAARVAEDKGL